MPALTYDGRSFQIEGRRIWIVSGSLHYARIPREHWEERIHLAKLAGLNTIDVPVFWNRHEPRPGHFDFAGDNDLRQFVQLIGQAGMYCILRPGPYVGEDWDFGGLPPWIAALKDVKIRASSPAFLEACSRYLSAVADRVRDLQVTSPGKAGPGGVGGGPIILVQNESQWTCGDDRVAEAYLGELNRYLREAGFTVPIINSNNLWQAAEGEIDCWTGSGDLLATVRQLAHVRPDRPRLVIDFDVTQQPTFGDEPPAALSAATIEQRLAEILAAGGQFNIHPFHGGTNFGFWGGRVTDTGAQAGGFATASRDHGCPLTEAGAPGPTFAAVRRLCTFASRFARVLSNLDPAYQPVVAAPATSAIAAAAGKNGKKPGPIDDPTASVIHATGPQGSVAFVFGMPPVGDAPGKTFDLLLPHGTTLPVEVGLDGVTWCVFDAFLGGRAKLDYCNVSAFAMVGKVLVVFGRPGAEVRLSINGSPLVTSVPRPKAGAVGLPELIKHEGCVVVVATREQLEQVFLTDDAVYVGAAGLSTALQPIAPAGAKNVTRVSADGEVSTVHAAPAQAPRRGGDRVTMGEWTVAGTADYRDGTSARFAVIDGPADLATLGCPYGYGWYRLRLKSGAGRVLAMAPKSADRLHLFVEGEPAGVLGRGPGATADASMGLKRGQTTLVVLAENAGRLASNLGAPELKGLWGELWEAKPLKIARPALKSGEPVEVLTFRTPVWGVQPGDLTLHERVTWTVPHKKKTPVVMTVGVSGVRGVVLVNDKPVALLDRGGYDQVLLDAEQLKSGGNAVQVALIADRDLKDPADALAALAESVRFAELEDPITEGAEWAFARWEPPRASVFQKARAGAKSEGPAWWRTTFRAADARTALYLDCAGLTKGQVYVNGRHVARYFAATAQGEAVPPATRPMIPAAWVRPGDDNELLIFDEHGGSVSKVALTPDPA